MPPAHFVRTPQGGLSVFRAAGQTLMVVSFPTPSRRVLRAERSSLGDLLAQLHEADDDEGLQAAVARIEDGERQAVIALLRRLCDKLAEAPAERVYIPY